jgi:hypothetical protein
MRTHYPGRDISIGLEETINQVVRSFEQRLNA